MQPRISNLLAIAAITCFLKFIPLSEAVSVPKIDVQLEGNTNYRRWALVVKGTLVVMGLWYAVIKPKPSPQTGAVAVPGGTTTGTLNQKEIEDWDEANDSAAAVISMSCGETAVNLLNQSWTAKNMWDTLHTAYSKVSAMEAFVDLRNLYRAQLDVTTPLLTQINLLTNTRDRIIAAGLSISSQNFALILLLALPDTWSHLSSAILAMTDLTKLDPGVVRARILDEETRTSSSTSGLATFRTMPQHNQQGHPRKTCMHCKMNGHLVNTCWKIHGVLVEEQERRKVSVTNLLTFSFSFLLTSVL